MERMPRRWRSIPAEEVQRKFDESTPEQYANGGLGNGPYALPPASSLVGKRFVFRFDSHEELSYEFRDLHTLAFRQGELAQEVFYQGHEIEEGVYFFVHIIKGSVPPAFKVVVADTNTGLVTLTDAHFGNGYEAREVSRQFYFGRIAGDYPQTAALHGFTSDLVGKAVYWTYKEPMPPLKHIYSSEYYYSYVMVFGDHCWMASNPADYIKINDHLYIFTFVEERQAGTQGFFLINMNTLHDVGCFCGINGEEQFECYTVGAKGELTTMETYLGK